MNTIDKLNKLNKSDFVSIFGNVFEKTTWIAEKVFNLRPFKTYDELSNKFISVFENEKKEVPINKPTSVCENENVPENKQKNNNSIFLNISISSSFC